MIQYHDLLQKLLLHGTRKENRTGVDTFQCWGEMLHIPMRHSFPLITTKKVHFKSVVHELLWMLSGETRIDYLRKHNVTIWDEWARESFRPELEYPDGELGPVYGYQWRKWPSEHGPIDQIANVVHDIRNNPTSRRIILNAWNVGQIDEMKLPPCHLMAQWNVDDKYLDCAVTMRSCDVFLGLPFNIAQYALLTHMIAEVTDKVPRTLVMMLNDAHLYENHVQQAVTQLRRTESPFSGATLALKPRHSIDDFTFGDISLIGYHPHPAIKAPVAV
jgi:thymidylate synthase